jgi:uncharacterized lipoprotein YajG
MKKYTFLMLSSIASVIALQGCALTIDRVNLNYKKMDNVAKINEANDVSVSVVVNDSRANKTKVSSKKNGFGMEMAPIVANEDIAVTIKKAFEAEITSRGFTVANKEALVNIIADVSRFYNDHKIGFFSGDAVADLHMAVAVKNKVGANLYSKQINCQGVEKNTQLNSGNNAKLALENALQNGMKILFEDKEFISALIKAKSN